MKKNNLTIVQFTGSLLVLIGAALKFFEFHFANYVFAAGAAVLIGLQVFYMTAAPAEEDARSKRLSRLMFLVTSFLGVAAYFMFTGKNTWVPLVLIYALVSLFLSFRSRQQ